MAAFVVDAGAVPLLINQQGRSLIALESGIHSGRAGLVTDRASETRLLRELVALCAATTIGEGRHPGGTFRISRRPPRSSLHVMVAPVRFHEELAHGRRAVAILFIHDPSERAKLEPAALRRLYGLTGAETRLAVLIAQGRTVSEVCALLDVTPNTVRTHLKRIFQKTQTRSQSQLVYELLTGLASIAR
jgi:DNA-binding CsgD family transcriptional regulator